MKYVKGDIKDAKQPKDKKRVIVVAISARTDDFDHSIYELWGKYPSSEIDIEERRVPGKIIFKDPVIYIIPQLLPDSPKHYDLEKDRLEYFEQCLGEIGKLNETLDGVIDEIAIPYHTGCDLKSEKEVLDDMWENRKKILKAFQKKTGISVLIYVRDDDEKLPTKN